MRFRIPVRRDTLREDAVAGLVLGVESVPDGLAAGLLAGVNPRAGLYAYLFGTIGGSFFTSSVFMAADGRSPVIVGLVAAGFAVAAAAYWLAVRGGQSSPGSGGDGMIPSAAAQSSSS